jgi:hypothetical protein
MDKNLSALQWVYTGSGAHLEHWVTLGFSPGIRRPRIEAGHSCSSSADFENERSRTSTSPYAFMASVCPIFISSVPDRTHSYSDPTLHRIIWQFLHSLSHVARIRTPAVSIPNLTSARSWHWQNRTNCFFSVRNFSHNSNETQAARMSLNSH